jgi:hypothetical protein
MNLFATNVVLNTKILQTGLLKAREFDKDSVINQNNYTQELDTVHVSYRGGILKGREQDRKK